MNRLPCEVQAEIFSHLGFKDKLEIALTSRDWYTKVLYILYTSIGVKYTINETAYMKYIHDKGLGHQISDLRMSVVYDPLELSKLCPNLKSLQVQDWMSESWNDNDNTSLAQNWEKLKVIEEVGTGYLITTKLLGSPLYMTSLTSITLDHLHHQTNEVFLTFIKQSKHAPALEYLTLGRVARLSHQRLDLLHKNTPNLKHLDLRFIEYLFMEDGNSLKECRQLGMDPSTTYNLRSFSVTFMPPLSSQSFSNKGLYIMYWMVYICRKYPSLISVVVQGTMLEALHHKRLMIEHLRKALVSWKQLKNFDMELVHLSKDILQTMDDCNMRLEELKVYIHNSMDMDQFIDLAHSSQGKVINRLTIEGGAEAPRNHPLAYFLQSLDKNNCQLKDLEIDVDIGFYDPSSDSNILSPLQVLNYVPSLERLSMRWAGTISLSRIACIPTTRLTHLKVTSGYFGTWNSHSLEHFQDVIYASPLLQSFSITLHSAEIHGGALDLEQNTKLKRVKYFASSLGDYIGIIQNSQMKWYIRRELDTQLNEIALREYPQRYRIILRLPSTIRSFFAYGEEYRL